MLSIIVATSLNNAIGKDNAMLWHLPTDFKFFKNTTWGMPIIMGRLTYESIGKPLPGRTNIVVTRNKNWAVEGTIAVPDITTAIAIATATGAKETFIAGGGNIYQQCLPLVSKIYRTQVHTEIEGDTFFGNIEDGKWSKTFEKNVAADDKNKYAMSFQTWYKI